MVTAERDRVIVFRDYAEGPRGNVTGTVDSLHPDAAEALARESKDPVFRGALSLAIDAARRALARRGEPQ